MNRFACLLILLSACAAHLDEAPTGDAECDVPASMTDCHHETEGAGIDIVLEETVCAASPPDGTQWRMQSNGVTEHEMVELSDVLHHDLICMIQNGKITWRRSEAKL